eukprot:SM000114S24117  [mRNA]  locus=s114:9056:10329:- [translate_table: standard]
MLGWSCASSAQQQLPFAAAAGIWSGSPRGCPLPPPPDLALLARRPWRVNMVAQALLKMGIRGVTITDVKGFGAQGGSRERHAGSEFTDSNFVSKVKLEVVIVSDQVEALIDTIITEARTGEIGDGKIFVYPVLDIVRIRTGERGLEAERMVGGRAELLSKTIASFDGN